MLQKQAQEVLRKTIAHLRNHPETLCKADVGSLAAVVRNKSRAKLRDTLDEGEDDCCVGTLLYAQCCLVLPGKKRALMDEVVKLICKSHQQPETIERPCESRMRSYANMGFIWLFNDRYCHSAGDAVRFLEKALVTELASAEAPDLLRVFFARGENAHR